MSTTILGHTTPQSLFGTEITSAAPPPRSLLIAHIEAIVQQLDRHAAQPRLGLEALASDLEQLLADHTRGAYDFLANPPWQIERLLGVRTGSGGQRLGTPTAMDAAGDLRRQHARVTAALIDSVEDTLRTLRLTQDSLSHEIAVRALLDSLLGLIDDTTDALVRAGAGLSVLTSKPSPQTDREATGRRSRRA